MTRSAHVEIFKDSAGEWRWRLRSVNGHITGNSGEGFTRKWSAKRAARAANPGVTILLIKEVK